MSASGAKRADDPNSPQRAAASARRQQESKTGGVLGWLRETALIAVAVVVLMALLRMFVVQIFVIPSGSMEHTLDIDDRIVVPKFLPHHRGDIVVFGDPGGWLGMPAPQRTPSRTVLEFLGLLPDTSENYLVKRIIGMPGDRVKCCAPDGKLTINGVELDESSYLYSQGGQQVKPSDFPFEVVVPAGHVFVMGDHRNNSDDSRCHLNALGQGAFVPENKIKGVVGATYWPTNRWHSFTTPASYAAIPAPASIPAEAEIHAEQVTCR